MVVSKLPVRIFLSVADAARAAQDNDRIGKLRVDARRSGPELASETRLVALNRGEAILPVRFKTYERSVEKGRTRFGGRFEYLLDLAASTVIFPNLQALYAGAAVLIGHADIVRLRDRFETRRANGYSDMIVNLRMKNGHIVEMQLHVQPMFVAKQFEQVLYSRRRVLATADPVKHAALIAILNGAARQIYALAHLAIDENRRLSDLETAMMAKLTQQALDLYETARAQV
jgi:hypothetical protein